MNGQYGPGDVVLGNWTIVRPIGEGGFGRVFEAEREEFGRVYKAAIKVITIPKHESEVKSVLAEGMTPDSITPYFLGLVEELVSEFSLMSDLKGNSNIVSYEDHTVVRHTEGVGWDIFIRMELLTPLLEHEQVSPLTRDEIIRLGIDMCKALELCQRFNIIHRDVKPENIFISETGDFKLGDFGIARTVEKTTGNLSKKGTYTYMAPEIYRGDAYGSSVDIYSLGIVLYRMLNDNRTPFMPDYPALISVNDKDKAVARRVAGEKMPPPRRADGRLAEIVLKACAFTPRERYTSPKQMREELEAVLYNREAPTAAPREYQNQFAHAAIAPPAAARANTDINAYTPIQPPPYLPERKKRKILPLLIGIPAALIALTVAVILLLPVILPQPVILPRQNGGDTADGRTKTGADDTPAPTAGQESETPDDPESGATPAPPSASSPEPPSTPSPEPPKPSDTPTPSPTPTPTPAPPEPVPDTLEGAILGTTDWVRINVYWPNGRTTVFERDRNSPVWTMLSRDGNYRMVEPDFSSDGGVFAVGFPTTTSRYYFNADYTGNFGSETMTWDYITNPSYSRRSSSGANQTRDLYGALSRYSLLVINVYWGNGETTTFYRQENGTWLMKGRDGSFTTVSPSFSGSSSQVSISFAASSGQYVLYDGGTGAFGGENLTWEYSYSHG